jgi:hypothetical protein
MNRRLKTITSTINADVSYGLIVHQIWFIVLILIVPLLFFVYLIFLRVRHKMALNAEKGKIRHADMIAIKELNRLKTSASQLSNDKFYAALHKIMLTFLEHRLQAPVFGDTMNELSLRLISRGVDESLAGRIIALLESFEFSRFAKGADASVTREKEIENSTEIIKELAASVLAAPKE